MWHSLLQNTVWHRCLTEENFDEFDKSKLHHQNFPSQYFAVELNNLGTSTCNIYGSCESAYWSWISSLSARSGEAMMYLPKYFWLRVYFHDIDREQCDKNYIATWPSMDAHTDVSFDSYIPKPTKWCNWFPVSSLDNHIAIYNSRWSKGKCYHLSHHKVHGAD